MVRSCDYQRRPHGEIREFYREHGWPSTATSQDGGREMAFWRAGYRHISMVVNRAKCIGAHGVHQNPSLFSGMGYDNIKLANFATDERIARFRLVDRPFGPAGSAAIHPKK